MTNKQPLPPPPTSSDDRNETRTDRGDRGAPRHNNDRFPHLPPPPCLAPAEASQASPEEQSAGDAEPGDGGEPSPGAFPAAFLGASPEEAGEASFPPRLP